MLLLALAFQVSLIPQIEPIIQAGMQIEEVGIIDGGRKRCYMRNSNMKDLHSIS